MNGDSEEEEMQDGFHVLYCRGCLFDAVKLFGVVACKTDKKTAKTMSLYNNFASDIQRNYIDEEEPVVFIEYEPDMLEYVPMPDTDLKGRGYVLLSGARKIEKAFEEGLPSIEYVALRMEDYLPLIKLGNKEFAFHWNSAIDQRSFQKEIYLNAEHERELSAE